MLGMSGCCIFLGMARVAGPATVLGEGKYEIYAGAFGDYLSYDLFLQVQWRS